jgi:hypothetical protein
MTTTLNHSVVSKTKNNNRPRITFRAIALEVLQTSHHVKIPKTAKQSKINNPVRSAGWTNAAGMRENHSTRVSRSVAKSYTATYIKQTTHHKNIQPRPPLIKGGVLIYQDGGICTTKTQGFAHKHRNLPTKKPKKNHWTFIQNMI